MMFVIRLQGACISDERKKQCKLLKINDLRISLLAK